MIEQDRLQYYLSLKHELPDVEFKGPSKRSENPFFGKVVRAAMGMANRPGGGTIIIGVIEQAAGLIRKGLSQELLDTWKYENIADGFNAYAEPPILFDRQVYEYEEGTYLVLDIHEFTDVPIICKQEYRDTSDPKIAYKDCKVILRKGAFYARSENKPETKEIQEIERMRPLFQLVRDKGIRAFVAQAQAAGLSLKAQEDAETLFVKQLHGWSSKIVEDIHSRGYWHVVIHPTTFQPDRLRLSDLFPLVHRTSFDIRGWPFPFIADGRQETGNDWVGSENEWDRILEAWRLYQSGLFVHDSGILDDWLDRSKHFSIDEHWRPGIQLSILGLVYRMTEIFEFASRLAVADTYQLETSLVVDIALYNTQGRTLYDPGTFTRFPFTTPHSTSAEFIHYPPHEFRKEEIIAHAWDQALDAAQFFLERFGWSPSKSLLKSIQSEIRPNWLKTDE